MKSAVPPDRLTRALSLLDPFQRDVISALLRGEEECPDETLAERHGTTPRAVRAARSRACKRLRDLLSS